MNRLDYFVKYYTDENIAVAQLYLPYTMSASVSLIFVGLFTVISDVEQKEPYRCQKPGVKVLAELEAELNLEPKVEASRAQFMNTHKDQNFIAKPRREL